MLQVKLEHVRAGCVGRSIELNVWLKRSRIWKSHYGYVSIGRRYDGRWWLIRGGY